MIFWSHIESIYPFTKSRMNSRFQRLDFSNYYLDVWGQAQKNMLWDSAVRCLLNMTARTSFLKQYLIKNSLTTQIWRRILFFEHKPNCWNIQRTWHRFKNINVKLEQKITLELITISEPRSNFEANPPILRKSFLRIGKFT